jgi:hypothetical protein
MRRDLEGWHSTTRRGPGGEITSEERIVTSGPLVEQTPAGALALGEQYWAEVARASRGVLSRRPTSDGFALRLLGHGPNLLRFGPAEIREEPDVIECRYAVRGGLLARRAAGAICLSQSVGDGAELTARVTDFVPRWSGAAYRQVQHRLHVAISRRYFTRLLEGEGE